MNTPALSPRVRALLARLADAIIPHARDAAPANVVSLAYGLGAYDVVYRARSAHGFTDWTPRGPRVVLNWAETEGRRRMVLAHECGHLLFDPVLKPEALESLSPTIRCSILSTSRALGRDIEDVALSVDETDLEILCDAFAYEVLLPRMIASQAADAINTIDDLSDFCDRWRISMSVAVLGLNRHRGAPDKPRVGILQSRRTAGNYWMAASTCGLPSSWRRRVVFASETGQLMDKMRASERRVEMVGISDGERRRTVIAQIAKYRERATVMVRTEDLT